MSGNSDTADPKELQSLPGWRHERTKPGAIEKCSLIVATYHRPSEVMKLVNHLLTLAAPPDEVIIVDGSPDLALGDQLRQWASGELLPFTLIYAESSAGLTRQRNAGLDLSTGRYLFWLDDDAIPLKGYFSTICKVLEQEPSIGAVAGCIINEINRPLLARFKVRFALGLIPRMQPMMYFPTAMCIPRCALKPFHGIKMMDVFPGGAVAIRRQVFDHERFSEFFQGYSQGEDFEMSLRIRRRWKVACAGDAHVVHNPATGGRPPRFAKGMMEVVNRHFIWTRYTPKPSLRIRLLFWADVQVLIAADLAAFATRPWRLSSLCHAAGLAIGAMRCMIRPPSYEEPPVRRQFALQCSARKGAQ